MIRSIGSRVPSSSTNACDDAVRTASTRESGQDLDGLGDVPARGRGPDAEPGRELGVRVAVADMGKSEPGLTADTQAPPAGTEFLAALTELGGQEAQGRAGHSTPDG
ncbi:hypothetical protein SHO565_73760 [Streptomyces sp. HO565]